MAGRGIFLRNLHDPHAPERLNGAVEPGLPPAACPSDGSHRFWNGQDDLALAASRLRYEFDDRFSMIIGSPFAGRKVTRNVGHTAWPGVS